MGYPAGGSGGVVLPETELVSLRIPAGREPAHARHGHRLVGFAAKLSDAGGTGVDHEGDQSALAALYDRHVPGIYDHIARFLRDPFGAEDLVQATFVLPFPKASGP